MVPFTFMSITRTILGEVISEKANKTKEMLKLNGLSDLTYQLYCFIITVGKISLFCAIISLGAAICYFWGSTTNNQITNVISYGEMITLYILGGLATGAFILFLSTLFSDPKFATDLGGFIYILISLGSFTVFLSNQQWVYYLVCLFP